VDYWVCHLRGADFADLERQGFITFYPYCDDYAFLPAIPENRKFIRREARLQVMFLRNDTIPATISEVELEAFKGSALSPVQIGAHIEVLEGPYEKMHGTILSNVGTEYTCSIDSYNGRTYEVVLTRPQFAAEETSDESVSR
jgi:hypothetical protein